jgi:hypothetical protein
MTSAVSSLLLTRGNNTAKNINYHVMRGDGYVYSQTVRGAHKELKEYIFDEKGYTWLGDDYKIKSRIYPRQIAVIGNNGRPIKKRIDEKQIIFYSRDYDRRAKAEREPAILKAMDLVKNPSKYNRATSYGAARYVKNIEYDKKTGEIITSKKRPVFDEARLREEEKFDGYYAIVTSELDKADEEIIDIYRGLWRIEESFKITKGDLKPGLSTFQGKTVLNRTFSFALSHWSLSGSFNINSAANIPQTVSWRASAR